MTQASIFDEVADEVAAHNVADVVAVVQDDDGKPRGVVAVMLAPDLVKDFAAHVYKFYADRAATVAAPAKPPSVAAGQPVATGRLTPKAFVLVDLWKIADWLCDPANGMTDHDRACMVGELSSKFCPYCGKIDRACGCSADPNRGI